MTQETTPLTIDGLIAALQSAKLAWQLDEGESYHLVIVPAEVEVAKLEQYETVELLLARLYELHGLERSQGKRNQVFCFVGIYMPIVRKSSATGTVRYLQTPDGKRLIADTAVEEVEEVEEAGFLSDPPPVAEVMQLAADAPEEPSDEASDEEDTGYLEDDDEAEDDEAEEIDESPAPPMRRRKK